MGVTNGLIVGDDFTLAASGPITQITVWEAANNTLASGLGDPGLEFSSISLYLGADGSPLSLVSSSYVSTQVTYQPAGSNYVDSAGNVYPIFAISFSLNFAATGGVLYDFAVDAVGNSCASDPFADPTCLLYVHGSNSLSGTPQQGADGQFRFFTVSAGTASFSAFCDSVCQASSISAPSTDINIQIQGAPEPATLGTLGASLAGLFLLARKRRK